MANLRYAVGGSDGWLRVKSEPSGEIISIPEYLKVDLTSSKDGRDYFKILEGVNRGKNFSVKSGNFTKTEPAYKPAASLRYNLSTGILKYDSNEVRAISDPPIPIGTHNIQIPDFPHSGGNSYLSYSKYSKTWFYLGVGEAIAGRGDRYIHPGRATAGCITVDPASWNNFYNYLILCRSNDEKNVGTVIVVR